MLPVFGAARDYWDLISLDFRTRFKDSSENVPVGGSSSLNITLFLPFLLDRVSENSWL